MKQKTRRLIAVLCVFCMLFTGMPVSVWAVSDPATPTDLEPVVTDEQAQPEDEEPEAGEEPEIPEETEVPEDTEEPEEAEEPEETEAPEETEGPEICLPEADREVTGSDDITVTGSLEGNPPADYLIRFYPEKSQTLCLILTADGELKASITDEHTGTTKQLAADQTAADENVLTLPYYKVKQDCSCLIRISGDKPAEFSLRMVKKSILEDETATETPAEEPEETPAPETTEPPAAETEDPEETAEEPEETPAPETTEPPAAEPEDPEPAADEPTAVRIDAVESGFEAWLEVTPDAGVPQDAEFRVRELAADEQEAYLARTVCALKCEDESYLRYARYLELTLVHEGEAVELKAPVTVSINLNDVREGVDAIQAVCFGEQAAVLPDTVMTGHTVSFRTDSLAVFGICNALTPLTAQETGPASVEVLGFSADAEVSLEETEAPEVEEGLEVLGSYIVSEQTEAAGEAEQQDGLWIKAELSENAELSPLESVSLYRVEDGQAEILVEDLSEDSGITELDATQVAVVRDTGYRHLTLTVNPDGTDEEQSVTLDGLMPKEAEAVVVDVTADYAEYAYPADGTETEDADQSAGEDGTVQTRTTLAAFDISITNGDEAYQPDEDKPVSVEILDSRITTEKDIELWHIRDDGTREQVTEFTAEEGRILFEAAGFSVYAVIVHEGGEVAAPRVEFHFIRKDAPQLSDGTHAYYEGTPYLFRNTNTSYNDFQSTQILRDGESLELIVDPTNEAERYFYGWYVVDPFVISGTTDEYGIGTGTPQKLYYTWPALPESVTFEKPISIEEKDVDVGTTVHWEIYGVSGSGEVDRDGCVHVFLAPVYEKYNFVNFMLHARDTETQHSANNLMTRKLIAMGSAENVEMKISDIRSTSKDAVHLIFTGWEYKDKNGEWNEVKTVDPTGAEIKQPGRDGVYLTSSDMPDKSSIDLYPLFVEARWMDFISGISGSGASFVGSRFLEAWGRATPDGTEEEEGKNIYTALEPSVRKGYDFEGWYAFAVTDSNTGEITNLSEPKDVIINYIDNDYEPHSVTLHTKAIRIADENGAIFCDENCEMLHNGVFTVEDAGSTLTLFSVTDGKLKFFDPLDRLTLYANWTPDTSAITIVYWTENAEDSEYTSSAVRHITTTELNEQLGTSYASGSEITREGLAAYVDETANVSVLSPEYLDDAGAVPKAEIITDSNGREKIIKPTDAIFYDMNTELSDNSKTIDGEGSTIFNVYYSRKMFTLVFHIGRDGYVKCSGHQKTAANWDGNWLEFMYKDDAVTALGYPHSGGGRNPGKSYQGVYTMTYNGVTYDSTYPTTAENVMGDYNPVTHGDSNIYTITAKYGAKIGDRWPTRSNDAFAFNSLKPTNPDASNEHKTEKTFYIWAAYYGSLYCRIANERSTESNQQGANPDINGIYSYMSAELCANRAGDGVINANQVHHLVAYYGNTNNTAQYKQYHTLYEAVEGSYDPDAVELVPGTDYVELSMTTWTQENTAQDKKEIIGKYFYEIPSESPEEVISNLQPQFQLSSDLEGYQFIYSCYETNQRPNPDVSGQNDYHVYFFYRPNLYSLTFMYENAEDQKTDQYYYRQSLKDAKKYDDPEKEGYRFLGWYTNEAGSGDPFDFENTSMPDKSLVLYPVFQKLEYVVRIDPNGAVIDHWRPTSTSSGASTGFRANYKEKISAYNFLERNYLKTNDNEIANLNLNPATDIYYYLNTQYLGEEHDGNFIPSKLRNALYLTASEIDSYWAWYSAVPEEDFTKRNATKFTDKNAWMDAYFGGHDLESLPKYRYKQGVENYSFMGWYQVYSNGSLAKAPFNFNTLITEDTEIRAMWRLDGGYYLQYLPWYYDEDDNGNIMSIIGELEQWFDPEEPLKTLYADQSPTHILRGPTNVTQGWVFRGWRVVREDEEEKSYTNEYGETVTYRDYIPMQKDANGNVIYYQPGDSFLVDSAYVTANGDYGGVIYMQAYYEPEDTTSRRPGVTQLTLDANETYVGGYINTTDQRVLPKLDHPGTSAINTADHLDADGNPKQILFGDVQSNLAVHLYRYATTKTFDGVQGTNLFSNDGPYMLIGFDEHEDPADPMTGSPYVPTYFPDSVIAVTRDSDITLYAMWEPKIYVTFVNTTGEDLTVELGGTGTSTVHIVNMVTGEYDREETTGTIVVPAKSGDENGMVKVVLPRAGADTDTVIATAVNDHLHKRISVSGEYGDQNPYGEGCEDIPYGYDVEYTGILKLDPDGIVVTYTEEDDRQVDYNVNGGVWRETSQDYANHGDGLYSLDSELIENNQYEPKDPDRNDKVFIGWTTNADIAAHTNFTGTHAVTWGNTVIIPDEGSSLLDKVREEFLWDFSNEPPYDDMLYAVWSDMVTVTFDLLKEGTTLHTWNGPATTDESGSYVFYRESTTSRYVTYKMAPGDVVPKPDDPSGALSGWYFIRWLKYDSTVANYPNRNNISAGDSGIKNFSYDFSKEVTNDLLLITSWSGNTPQTYSFIVENRVENGSDDEEYTYHIAVTGTKVWGKLGTSGNNTVGDSEKDWGSFDVNLKNNHQYTVLVTVQYLKTNSWDACSVQIDVIDENGLHLKSDPQVTYANRNGTPTYVGGYKYNLTISQEKKPGVESTVSDEVLSGTISYDLDRENLIYKFQSKWGSLKEGNQGFKDEFTPTTPVNGYPNGEETHFNNSLRLIFTNVEEIIVAPTGYTSRFIPYLLMLVTGLLLLITGGAGIGKRRRKTEEEEYDTGPGIRKNRSGPGNRGDPEGIPRAPDQQKRGRLMNISDMKGVVTMMKKIGAVLLAAIMITVCAAACAANSDGTRNDEGGIETTDNSVRIAKQIVFVNAEATTVREPNITYTYTIASAAPGNNASVTDADDNNGPVKAGPIAAVSSTTATVSFVDTTTASASSAGTASDSKYAEFTFDPGEFKESGTLTPGIYRYEITESCSPAKASVGITEASGYAAKRYLDVYVKWNTARTALEIYGFVLFEGTGTDSLTADATDVAKKSAGYVNTATTGQADVDVYTTQNLYISKTTTGALASVNNDFPISVTLTAPSGVSNVKLDVTKTGSGALTTSSDTVGDYVGAWGSVTGTVRNGSQIAIKGIPAGATASLVETNNTVDSYKVKAGSTSGAADLLAEAAVAASADSDATTAVTLNTAKAEIFLTNTLDTISPTGYVVRFAPYALMLIGGIVLLIVAKKHKKHTDEE